MSAPSMHEGQGKPIRVPAETHEVLKELAAREQRPVTQVVARLVAEEQRRVRLEELNVAFGRLLADPARAAAYREESRELEGTLMDGLEGDEGTEWDESLIDTATW